MKLLKKINKKIVNKIRKLIILTFLFNKDKNSLFNKLKIKNQKFIKRE